MRQEITDQVTEQVTQQFYCLAAQYPQAFLDLVPQGSQSTQIPSSVGSVENTTYPVDSITGPTPFSLVVPIGRAGKTKEVSSGMAIPGRQFHNSPIPADYARVQVARVNGDQMSLELDIPTPEGIELLGDAVNQFILWHRRDIILTGQFTSTTPAPSVPNTAAPPAPPSPPICTTPPGSPLQQISPLRGPSPPPQQTAPNSPTPLPRQPSPAPQLYLAPPLDEHVPPPQPDTSKEQQTTCEARKLIPVMVYVYNKEKMAEYEMQMVLQSLRGSAKASWT
jgi:hypothetical protein